MPEILRFTVDDSHHGCKAGRFLRTVCRLSARSLALLKRTSGGLTVNGELLRTIDILNAGDVVEIRLPSEKSSVEAVEDKLDILYEDEWILVVNKPAGTPVHPVKKHQQDTLANFVSFRYKDTDSDFVFRAVNRLDADTSGAVIIAKDRHTASLLQSADIQKHYTAVCHGKTDEIGTIDAPISLRADSKLVRCVSECGQHAVTHYKLIKTSGDISLLDITLDTGRTHQIRCHMSYIGHPLLGDDLYGGSTEKINRQALHCRSLSFLHPYKTDVVINIVADIPDDIRSLII